MSGSDVLASALASVGATLFTNPIEVVKTRIQLQGELAKRGTYVKPYRNVLHAFITVARNDGVKGLQKGLAPAMCFQLIFNSVRLPIYTLALEHGWVNNSQGTYSLLLGLCWGAVGGMSGAFAASPFFMIKTQLQAQSAKAIAVGHQHSHKGMANALLRITRKHGVLGLWRGSLAVMPRSGIGAGTQIGTYGLTKELLRKYDLVTQPTMNSFCSGMIAGFFVSITITPPDVISTRLYNQAVDAHGRGLKYTGWLDCFGKIYKTEGVHGLYKGYWGNFLRIGPHSMLLLVFYDELLALKQRYIEVLKF